LNLTDVNTKLKCVIVSKGRTIDDIRSVIAKTGLNRIAENRLKEAQTKLPHLENLEKHFIGKLQSRKIPHIVELFDVIQTVENLKQATLISEQKKEIKVFLQVNLEGSSERSGCLAEEVPELVTQIQALSNLKLQGLMGMASQDAKLARSQFRKLKSLQGDLPECSMGMSSDYKIAIEEGSTMLRVGRLLFEGGTLDLPDGLELE
jgi:pyridoxal phosphate enzyme (YggS family)